MQLLEALIGVAVPLLGMMVAILIKYSRSEFQLRLMWRDYQKRHGIPAGNGNGEDNGNDH